jgi:hypothetical protein
MPVKLRTNGVEFAAVLRRLPTELRNDALPIVVDAANRAMTAVGAAYPEVTGNLRRGLKLEQRTSEYGAWVRLRSTSKHAHLVEDGSVDRRHDNGKDVGRMPAAHIFVPIVIRERRDMEVALIDLVRRAGFKVHGR